MEQFKLQQSHNTPRIFGSVEQGLITIEGVCRPENSIDYFREFMHWIKYFNLTATKDVSVLIDLEYMNTSSGLILYRILSSIKRKLNTDQQIQIIWKHQLKDVDMKQVGEDFKYMLGDIIRLEVAS
jgi:hypothetical protein